jgi:hypothetical protein
MRRATLLLALAIVGCSGASVSSSHGSPSAASRPAAGLSPSTSPATSPTGPSPSPVMLSSCRLPFTDFTATGFIRGPDGAFRPDTSSATQPDPSRPGFVRTVASPALYGPGGNGQETYDWRFSRWLPVPHELVSPDGSQYAYSELIPNPASQGLGGPPPLGTLVHVVDVATGNDHIVYQSADVLSAVTVKAEGIYLTQPTVIVNTVVPFYVWLVDPATRVAHKLLGGKSVGPGTSAFTQGTLWIMATDPNNTKDTPKLLRVNLSDGSQSTWFEPISMFAQFLGLDGLDHPIVSTFSGTNGDPGKTWVVIAASTVRPIADEGFTGQLIADGHGLWLTGNGVFLYPAGGPMRKVSTEVGGWLLGACG